MDSAVGWCRALEAIGAIAVLYTCYKCIDAVSLWLLPTLPMTRYSRRPGGQAWALVTGASAGIGFGCAQELAARGFNVVILGHKAGELAEAKRIIEAEYPAAEVRVLLLNVITATTAEIEAALETISDLQLTVLVNNVGGVVTSGSRRLHEDSPLEVEQTLNLNARFTILATRHMLPVLERNSPSLVLTLSSVARTGMPMVATYSACKAFVLTLSKAAAREARADNRQIDILAVVPSEVQSQMNPVALMPGTPSSRRYAQAIFDRAPRAVSLGRLEMAPWWLHAVQIAVLECLPEWVSQKLMLQFLEKGAATAAASRKAQ